MPRPLIPPDWRKLRGIEPRLGRFYVEPTEDGWRAVDSAYGTCLETELRREAEDLCRFARLYTKRHRDIDFETYPYALSRPLHYDDEAVIRQHWLKLCLPQHPWIEKLQKAEGPLCTCGHGRNRHELLTLGGAPTDHCAGCSCYFFRKAG